MSTDPRGKEVTEMSALRAVNHTADEIALMPPRAGAGEDHGDAQDAAQAGGVVVNPAKLKLQIAPHSQVPAGETDPAVWLVGAHGGAGVSTLAHVWAPAGDSGRRWPSTERSLCCAVVCRSTAMGLEDAHDAIIQARSGLAGEVTVLGLVVVADSPGRTPKALEQKIAVISAAMSSVGSTVWRVPYFEEWRGQMRTDLPIWLPGDEPVRKRRGRLPPGSIPPVVGEIGQEMFAAFRKNLKERKI